jgi:hypothetical protein
MGVVAIGSHGQDRTALVEGEDLDVRLRLRQHVGYARQRGLIGKL